MRAGDRTRGTGLIFDDDGLTERSLKRGRKGARGEVSGPASRKPNNHRDGFIWPLACLCLCTYA